MRVAWDILAIAGAALLICVLLKMRDDDACRRDELAIRWFRYSVFIVCGMMLSLSVVWRSWCPEFPAVMVLGHGDLILGTNFVALFLRERKKRTQECTNAVYGDAELR